MTSSRPPSTENRARETRRTRSSVDAAAADMNRHRDRTGLPDAEQCAEIRRPIADDDMHRLVRRDALSDERAPYALGEHQ